MGYFHIQCIQISAAAVHLNRYIYLKLHTCLYLLKNVCIFEEDN